MSLNSVLTAIADAIRSKTGTTGRITLSQMPALIYSISGGGGGTDEPGNPSGYFVTHYSESINLNIDDTRDLWNGGDGDTSGLDDTWYIDTGYVEYNEIQNDGVVEIMEHGEYIEVRALSAGTAIIELAYAPVIWREGENGEWVYPNGTYGSIVTYTINVKSRTDTEYYDYTKDTYTGETDSIWVSGHSEGQETPNIRSYEIVSNNGVVNFIDIENAYEFVEYEALKPGTAVVKFTVGNTRFDGEDVGDAIETWTITVTDKPRQEALMFPLKYDSSMSYYIGKYGADGKLAYTVNFDVWEAYNGTKTYNKIEFDTNGDIRYYKANGYDTVGNWKNTPAYVTEGVRTILVNGKPSTELMNFIKMFASRYNNTFTTTNLNATLHPTIHINTLTTDVTFSEAARERYTTIYNNGVIETVSQGGLMHYGYRALKYGEAQFYVEQDYTCSDGTAFTNKYIQTFIVENPNPEPEVTSNYGVWTFRNDIDADELRDYISARGTGDYINHVGFDIRFDVPGGAACTIEADEGTEHILYQFKRMEFHYNDEEGDSIIYYSAQGNDYGYVGAGTDLYYSRTIVLREQPSAELLAFLQLFFEQEYSSIFTIQLNNYIDYLEGVMIGMAAEEWTWRELAASGDEPSIYLDEGYSDANFPDGWMMLNTNDNTYHIQVQPSDVIMDGAVYEALYY